MTPRFGVNYVPSGDWFYSWLSPRWDAIQRDLSAIAALGLDHVRVMPLWPVLQPNRTLIRDEALADVRRVVQLAGEAGLDAGVDVLQGHLSSFDFVPAWLSTWHRRNMFTDPLCVAAQADLVAAVHDAVADLPGYLGLTLGNEVNQFSSRPHPTPMPATPLEVGAWLDALLAAVPPAGPGMRLHAPYDAVWYQDGHPFLPTHAARYGDVTAIHSWIFNGTAQHYGAMSPESIRHAEYLIELARAFAVDPARPVWLQEIGAPLNCLDESSAPSFCRRTVLAAADSPALWGVTWWCSHDVPRSLSDFPDLEHSLGLFDAHGAVKPIGKAFADVAGQIRAQWRSEGPPAPRTTAVVIPADAEGMPENRAALAPGGTVFTAWMDAAARGDRPALVLSGRGEGLDLLPPAPSGTPGVYSAVSDTDAFPS